MKRLMLVAALALAGAPGCAVDGTGTSVDAGSSGGSPGSGGRVGSDGGVGSGGTTAAGVCTSMMTWNGNDGALMAPGYACLGCHPFSVGGTLFPTAHEPNNCDGATASGGVSVVITGANGQTLTLTPNAAGNFYSTTTISTPFTAKVVSNNGVRMMIASQTSGDCNSCHTPAGTNGAPGRIMPP